MSSDVGTELAEVVMNASIPVLLDWYSFTSQANGKVCINPLPDMPILGFSISNKNMLSKT